MGGDRGNQNLLIAADTIAASRGVSEPKLSPSGELVAFISTHSGERPKLCVVSVVSGQEQMIASDPSPIGVHPQGGGAFDWCPDELGLVFVTKAGAVMWTAVDGSSSRVIVGRQPIDGSVASPRVSPNGELVAYTVHDRCVAVAAMSGKWWPQLVPSSGDFVMDPSWSADSGWLAWHEWNNPNMAWDSSRWVVNRLAMPGTSAESTWRGLTWELEESAVGQPVFSPIGSALAFVCDATGWMNLWALDPVQGELSVLVDEPYEHAAPTWGPASASFAWSPDGARIAFVRNENGFGQLCVVDVASRVITEVARGWHFGVSWKGNHVAAIRSGGVTPTQLVVYDTSDWSRTTLVRGPAEGIESSLVEPVAVHWLANDGTELSGRLYRTTKANADGPPPMLLWLHGGPTDQMVVQYNGRIAFFLDRGWSILVPDYRGSSGHGRSFQRSLNGQWGILDTSDNVAAIHAAIHNGWGAADAIVPMGGSAGGFGVLHLLAAVPHLCAAGVNLYGVADLVHLAATTHRFEKYYLESLVGSWPHDEQKYREFSPIFVVDTIASPLLILHGADDVVVPVEQSKMIAEKLQLLGQAVELHIYDGQGHGWRAPEVMADELTKIDEFLQRHVAGAHRIYTAKADNT